jgi:hypothetical protein
METDEPTHGPPNPPLLIDILRGHDLKFGRAVAIMNPDVVPRYDDAGDMVSFLQIRFNRCLETVHRNLESVTHSSTGLGLNGVHGCLRGSESRPDANHTFIVGLIPTSVIYPVLHIHVITSCVATFHGT